MHLPGNEMLQIKQWAEEDRPREKLLIKGRSALSDAELIGILLGSGTRNLTAVDLAKSILRRVDYDLNKLAKTSITELVKMKGIGNAKALTIVSALELGRRRRDQPKEKNIKITCSQDGYDAISMDLLDKAREEFWIILLNRANHIIRKCHISTGGVAGTVADPKVIFNLALEYLASSIVLVHNHPSGNLSPSEADKRLTSKMIESGKLLEIPVIDHIIIAEDEYFSFRDQNMM